MEHSRPIQQRSRAIDILRALAVIGTIYQHSYYHFTSPQELWFRVGDWKIYPFIFGQGWLGVNLFFILSGFVLYRPQIALDRNSVRRYYGQRAWRLWPLLFLLSFFFVFAKSGNAYEGLGDALLYCSGINNLIPHLWVPSLAVLWSLGVEILFSVALPLILWLQQRFGFARVCVIILVFCLVYRAGADVQWFSLHPDWNNPTLNPFKDNLFGRLDDFIFGMIAARFCSQPRLVIPRTVLIAGIGVLIVTLYSWNIVLVTPRSMALSVLVAVLHTSFAASSVVLLCWFYSSHAAQRRSLSPLVFLGQICYSVYIVHSFIYRLSAAPIDFTDLWAATGFFGVTLVFAFFCFVVIEARGIHRKPAWLISLEQRFGLAPA